MKRPALAAAIPVIIAALLSMVLPKMYLYIIISALIIIFIAGFILKNVHLRAVSGFMLAVFLSFALQSALLFGHDAKYEGRVLHLSARVVSAQKNEYILKVNKAFDGENEVKIRGRISAVIYEKNAPARDEFIEGDFLIRLPESKITSLGANYSDRVYLGAYQHGDIVVSDTGYVSPFDIVYHVQHYISTVCQKIGGEEGEFLLSLLTGKRDGLSENTTENFRVLGLSHIMAVSGLHLSVVMGMVLALLRKIKLQRIPKQIVCILFTLLVCIAAGFSPSVCRAGIMGLTIYTGLIFGRQSESLNSLGLAFVICLTAAPYMIFDAGFILSSAATLGIIFFCPVLNRYIMKVKSSFIRYILEMAAVCVCASVFVLPASVLYFGASSWVGIISGLLMEFFIYLLIMGGLLLSIMGFIPGISNILALILRANASLVLMVADYYGEKLSVIEFIKAPLIAWFIFVLFVAFLFYFFDEKLSRRLAVITIAVTFVICFVFSMVPFKKEMYVYNENGGNIDLCYIEDGGMLLVADCAGERSAQKMYSVMEERSVKKCEYVIMGNYDREHLIAAEFFIKNHLTRAIVLPDIEDTSKYDIIDKARHEDIEIITAEKPVYLDSMPGTAAAAVYPGRGEYFPDSMYFIYKHNGFTVMDTYGANQLPTSVKADLVLCSGKALEIGSIPKGCIIVNGSELPSKGNAIVGKGYISEITLSSNGKFSIKRNKI